MTNEEILNKIVEAFPEAEITYYRNLPILKIKMKRYYVRDVGDHYIVGVFLPYSVRLALIVLMFIIYFLLQIKIIYRILIAFAVYYFLYWLAIRVLDGGQDKKVFQKFKQILDKDIKFRRFL